MCWLFLHLTSRTMICQHKQSKQVTQKVHVARCSAQVPLLLFADCGASGGGRGRRGGGAGNGARAGKIDRFVHRTRTAASRFFFHLPPGSSSSFSSPCSVPLQSLRVLQHLLDERRHGARDLHFQCDHSLCS